MQIKTVDPRALVDNPDDARRSKTSPQADAILLATIKAVGIIQPPVVSPQRDGGNGYIIQAGHRRVKQAIAAGIEEITVLVVEAANDNGAMRSMVENIVREPLNSVDQWRGIERLVALDWTEKAIAVALALPIRQVRKLRLLANVLPAMLDQMALGDMPNEQQLRTIAAASIDEQKEVWKANRPKKNERGDWHNISRALSKSRMYARDASFGDDLAAVYGIEWVEDLFAPADQDSRYTTNVEASLTDRIVEELSKGVRPWMQPWHASNMEGRITRPLRHNGLVYSGMNVLLLWSEGLAQGFTSPMWMTFRQARQLGAAVRKGETGSTVVFASRFTKSEADGSGGEVERDIPFLKAYSVFNGAP